MVFDYFRLIENPLSPLHLSFIMVNFFKLILGYLKPVLNILLIILDFIVIVLLIPSYYYVKEMPIIEKD